MSVVGLHQPRIPDDVHQDERDEWNLVSSRKLEIRAMEGRRVRPSTNRQRFHTAQQNRNPPFLRDLDDVTQVGTHLRYGNAAKAIVHAKCQDEHADIPVEGPIQPGPSVSRCRTRDARVDPDLRATC